MVARSRPRLVVLTETFTRFNDVTRRIAKSPVKRHYSKLLFAALALIPAALLAQNLAPTPRSSDQAELSKVEEWVLSQGIDRIDSPGAGGHTRPWQ